MCGMCDRIRGWWLGLGVVLAAASAGAAPITATYAITGGTLRTWSFPGGDFSDAAIQSGTVIVSLPNPGSAPPPLSTTGHAFFLDLMTSGGGSFVRTMSPGNYPYGLAQRGSNLTLDAFRFRSTGIPPTDPIDTDAGFASVVASASGMIVSAFFQSVQLNYPNWSILDLTGQEVPAPGGAPIAGASMALLGAYVLLSRGRRRRERS